MFKRSGLLTLFLLFSLRGFAQEEGKHAGTVVLYDSQMDHPFLVQSDRGWLDLRRIELGDLRGISSLGNDMTRKWRVKTSYIDEAGQGGKSTLQVKLGTDNGNRSPIFTMPWTESAAKWQEKTSNWYISFEEAGGILEAPATLSVRLIAPPHTNSPGRIYRIELEAWDFPTAYVEEERQALRVASGPRLVRSKPMTTTEIRELKAEAQTFAFSFIEASLNGDLPQFYKSLAENVKILETGYSQSRYRVPPPNEDLGDYSLEEYKANYRFQTYGYEEYAELFPHWFDKDRRWVPDESCYLFMGTEALPGKEDFMKGVNLVFMVRKEGGKWEIVALPERTD